MRWPGTLLGRNALLLIGAITASQIAAVLVFIVFVQEPRVRDAAALLATQIVTVDSLLAALPGQDRARYATLLDARPAPPEDADRPASSPLRPLACFEERRFLAELRAHLPDGIALRMQPGPAARLWVQLRVAGQPCWIALPVARSARYRGVLIAIGAATLLNLLGVLVAWLIHRRIHRPLQQLVVATARLGRGERPEPVSLAGPLEISSVAAAFNAMTQALAETDAARALMLAGISHDIRTPLTKLRLAHAMPELAGSPQAAERYIGEIDAIVQQFIDFARGGDGEACTETDLNAMIEQLAADFIGLGQEFTLSLRPLAPVTVRPVSMLRLLLNVMENAARHGRVGLEVRSWQDGAGIHVVVADRGPGVEASLLPLLKQPFRRGDQAAQAPGTGLGLAIAERIAQQHGGRLALGLRAGGGLQVELCLPQGMPG